jgi:hypothetical protein
MAKIERKNQKIFAGDMPASGNVAQFGSLRYVTPNYSADIDVIQALDAWGEGWASAVISNYFPAIQDLNALYYVLTRQISYFMQSGIPEWNSAITYYIGSLVTDGLGGIYKSLVDTNLNLALTDSTKWLNFKSIKQTEIGGNYTVLNADYIIRWSIAPTTAGTRTVTLPTPVAGLMGRKVIVKAISAVTGGNVLVVTANASTISKKESIQVEQYRSRSFYCDGTMWICTGDFPP